jgi:dihydropteroate synthase
VTHDPSRKHFLGKILGLAAAAGVSTRLLARSAAAALPAAPAAAPVIVARPEPRAVARTGALL